MNSDAGACRTVLERSAAFGILRTDSRI